jgi:zinc protease
LQFRLAGHAAALLLLVIAGFWPLGARAMQIQQVTSPKGIGAWLVEDHSVPIVTLRFAFRGGAALDPSGKGGLAAMVSDLLDEGVGPYDTTAFHARLEELGGYLGFSAGQDEFTGSLRMLKTNLRDTAELLHLALTVPSFAPEAVERIRSDVLAALARQARSPRYIASRLWMHDAFDRHPYGSSASGDESSVAAITRDDLAGYVGARFRRNGLIVGIVGDLTATEAAALIDQVFGDLPARQDAVEVAETKPDDDGALVVRKWPVPQSVVAFGQIGLKRDDPDWYAALVLNDILGGGGFRGRLMNEIREKRGLAYGVSTELVPYRHAGLILGNVATENGRVAETIALVRAEWQRMRDEGPTQAELDAAKTYLTGSFPLSLDSTSHIAALLVQMQIDGLGPDYLDHRAALIGAVTLDQVRTLARRLLDPSGLSFVVVGEPAGVTATRPPRPMQH